MQWIKKTYRFATATGKNTAGEKPWFDTLFKLFIMFPAETPFLSRFSENAFQNRKRTKPHVIEQ